MALGLFLILLLLFAPVAASQQDFLSIDCGMDDDSLYIDAGENRGIAPDLVGSWESVRYDTLRSFPSGTQNCYALPTVAGSRYLLRAFFAYGNYDGKDSSSLQFDLHLGPNYWETTHAGGNTTKLYSRETIFVSNQK